MSIFLGGFCLGAVAIVVMQLLNALFNLPVDDDCPVLGDDHLHHLHTLKP